MSEEWPNGWYRDEQGGPAGLYAAPGCRGLALRAYAGRTARNRVAGPAAVAQLAR